MNGVRLKKKEFVNAIKLVKRVTSKKYPILRNVCLENDKSGNIYLVGTDLDITIVVHLRKAYQKDEGVTFRYVFDPVDMLSLINDYGDDMVIEEFDTTSCISISSEAKSRYVDKYAFGENYPCMPPYPAPSSIMEIPDSEFKEMPAGVFKDISSKLVNGRENDVVYLFFEDDCPTICYGTESTRTILKNRNISGDGESIIGIPGNVVKTMVKTFECDEYPVVISRQNDATVAVKCNNCYMLCCAPKSKYGDFCELGEVIVSMKLDKDSIVDGIKYLMPLTKYGQKRTSKLTIAIRKIKQGEMSTNEITVSINSSNNISNYYTIYDNINIVKESLDNPIFVECDIHHLHNILKAVSGDTVLFDVIKNDNVGEILRISSTIKGVSQQYLLVPFNRRIQYVL